VKLGEAVSAPLKAQMRQQARSNIPVGTYLRRCKALGFLPLREGLRRNYGMSKGEATKVANQVVRDGSYRMEGGETDG